MDADHPKTAVKVACRSTLDIARGARASILHVLDAPAVQLGMRHSMPAEDRRAYLEAPRKEAARALATFLTSVDWRLIRQDLRQVRNAPTEELPSAAREGSADLVGVGTQGRSGLARFFLGTVAEAVLRRADRHVLAVSPAATS